MRKSSLRLVATLVAASGLATFVVTTAMAGTSKKAANIDVCVLLPDTKSSVRWVQFDAPAFAKALKALQPVFGR